MSAGQEKHRWFCAPQASNRAMLRLGALTRLRRLGLAGTSLKDAGLALVAPLAALETLSLEWCSRITDAGGEFSTSQSTKQSLPAVSCDWS